MDVVTKMQILKKFPVIKNGVEYEILIYDDYIFGGWKAEVYQKQVHYLFGKIKYTKNNLLYDKNFYMGKRLSVGENLNKLNFIDMANKTIDEYLNKVNEGIKEKIYLKSAIDVFNNWDGVCKYAKIQQKSSFIQIWR